MATFHLNVVTPDRPIFDGEAERIILRTVTGDVCIMANHIDYAAPIGYGEAKIVDAEGNVKRGACAEGLLSVSKGAVRVMAVTFEWEDEIDLKRAEAAQEAATKRLAQLKREDADFQIAEAKLKRSIARIGVKKN